MNNANWKDHPIVVATIAVAATVGLMIALFTEVIIPTQIAHLTNQLADCPVAKKEKEEAEKKIILLEEQLTESKAKLLAAQQASPFVVGNPYPSGFGQVRLGDQISKVAEYFPAATIQKDEDSWLINWAESPFISILYFYEEKPTKKIYKIVYIFRSEDPDALRVKVTEALGTPALIVKSGHKSYWWKITSKVSVQMFPSDTGYILWSQ